MGPEIRLVGLPLYFIARRLPEPLRNALRRMAEAFWPALVPHRADRRTECPPAGSAEQRATADPVYTVVDERGRARHVRPPPSRPEAGSLIVVVQADHPETFREISMLLRGLPSRFSLCVAVPTSQGKALVEEVFAAVGLDAKLDCRVAGRGLMDFAGLLSEFPHDVLRHDLLLHLHTGQTPARGKPYDSLLGSPALIDTIMEMFSGGDDLGLLYPDAATDLPYWAHYSSPYEDNSRLPHRLGLEGSRQRYFDFPVDGMFWARVEAIRPLLEAGLAETDFPTAPDGTAGAAAFAIERTIVRLIAARGYRFMARDETEGVFRDNWSMRNLHQYERISVQYFADALADVDLVSFDIFDTLVTRPALEPDSVLHYVGYRILARNPGVMDFFSRRKAAEAAARAAKRFEGDVDLDEIYAAFEPGNGWTAELIRYAAALEREVDGATLGPRPDVTALPRAARMAGKRVVAITDTYYTRTDIAHILSQAGLRDAFDRLYISSVEQARKDRGDLWDKVALAEAIPPLRWLHVGDNERSDIQAACGRGVQAFHTMHPARLLENFGFRPAAVADRPHWAADLVVGPAMLRLASSPFLEGRPFRPRRLRTATDAGFVIFGPILFLFYAWLVRHPVLRQVRHLHFLSREGYLLEQIHMAVRKRFPELGLPAGSYFHASRRVALCAAQAVGFSPEAIMAGIMFRGTMRDMLRHRLGLEFAGEAALVDWQVELPRDRERLHAALESLRPVIMRHASEEREKLVGYARQSGMLEPGLQGVVDIGYSATIQKGLQTALSIPLAGFYLATFAAAKSVEDGGGQAFGFLAEGIPPFSSREPALAAPLFLEAFLTAPHGQVTGFREEEGRVSPTFKAAPLSAEETPILARMQGGALDYCLELLETYGPDLLYADIAQGPPQEFLRMTTEGKLILPDEVLGMLRVEDDYCGNGHIQVSVG